MYSSRNIDDLRADVAFNCRAFLALCEAEGYPVLVTNTVRDEAYQRALYEQGRSTPGNIVTNSPRPSFHAKGIGLAFDFCKNCRGHAYDDALFFERCGAIGERIGFAWGGRWARFPDRPHLQWSGPQHDYKSVNIWAGRLPPTMPRYLKEELEMTQAEVKKLVAQELAERDIIVAQSAQRVSLWAQSAWEALTTAGIFDGTRPGAPLTREQAAVVLNRLGALRRGAE